MDRLISVPALPIASPQEHRSARILLTISLLLLNLSFALLVSGTAKAESQGQSGNAAVSAGPNQGTFLMLSDIHFDPFFDANPRFVKKLVANPVEKWQPIFESVENDAVSPDGADSNYALLMSALHAARDSGVQYDYVLVTGDFLGHEFEKKYRAYIPDGAGYQDFVVKTILFVNRTIEQAFPGVSVYGTLGNNDSTGGDYAAPGRAIFAALAKEWKVIAVHPDARRDFLGGGFYAVPHPTVPSQEFIVLDTSFWSNRYHRDVSSNAADPGSAELDWLQAKLTQLQSEQKTAALIMHIPPGIDPYASSKLGSCENPSLFWKQTYMDSFLKIIADHKDILRDGYAGHTHMDDFRVLADSTGRPYFQTHIIPSISRDHHNNPAFEIGVYEKTTGALIDYAVTYLKSPSNADAKEEPHWTPEYDFREASGFPSYNPASLETIAGLIRSSEVIRKKFMDFYRSQIPPALSDLLKDWRYYSCAQTEITPGTFSGCVCPSPAASN